MSALNELKSYLPGFDDGGVSTTTYECQDCGHTFQSAKSPDRAQCMDCMSHEVEAA